MVSNIIKHGCDDRGMGHSDYVEVRERTDPKKKNLTAEEITERAEAIRLHGPETCYECIIESIVLHLQKKGSEEGIKFDVAQLSGRVKRRIDDLVTINEDDTSILSPV
jgi:hypothetical protein